MSSDLLARLRAADPAVGMPPAPADERDRLCRAIVSAPGDERRSRERSHPRRLALAAGVLAAALLLGAGAVYARTVLLAPSLRHTAPGWRQAPLDEAWKAALADGVVGLSRRVSLVPLASGDDGHTFFAAMYSKGFSGVVRVDAVTDRVTRIRRFAVARIDQASDGSFDGRWLVWSELRGFELPRIVAVWAWDSQTGRLQRIAGRRAASGATWTRSAAEVRDGLVTWTEPAAAGGLSEVHVFDLARGRDRVVHRGRVFGSFFVNGGLVVWGPAKGGGSIVTGAARAATGEPVALPPALAGLRGAGLATDGGAIVHADVHWSSLWWSPALSTAPRRLFAVRAGIPIDDSLQVAGRLIWFDVAPRSYLADTRSRRYVDVGPSSLSILDATSVVILRPSASKTDHPVSDVIFLKLASLPAIAAAHR
jgi:hypothetical protein